LRVERIEINDFSAS
jgi:hypothetical protein